MDLIEKILRDVSLTGYLPCFRDNHIDDALLPELTSGDLKELGVESLGHRKRILAAIMALAPPTPDAPPAGAAADEQRREVVVVFADMTGYTRLSRELPTEDMHEVLADLYARFDDIVRRMGGTVDRHIGDCVMAVFGAPVSHGNDAERALRASIAMHGAMRDISRKHGRELSVHIGIAAGRVLYSSRGQGALADVGFTVTGDSVNLASRLASAAQSLETLISDAIFQALRDRIRCEESRSIEVKGFDAPILTHRFAGFSDPVGPRAFVGREAERRQAAEAIEACLSGGAGRTICIRGEAGIGKTALLDRIAALAEARGLPTHRALLLDFGLGDNEAAVKVILSELSGLSVGATATAVRAASEALRQAGTLDQRGAYHFEAMMGLPPEGAARAFFESLDTAAHAAGRREMICRAVAAQARVTPFLIAIEDMHWADAETLALAGALAGLTARTPIILVLTVRREGDHLGPDWREAAGDVPPLTFDLAPITADQATELALAMSPSAEALVASCVAKAEGNPLFLEQLLRNAVETGSPAVPGSIQSLVQSRVDRLSRDDRQVLMAAAVIGQRFRLDAATAIAGIEVYDERPLVEASLVRPMRGAFLFSHALVREGVYGSILRDALRDLHRRAAAWFEERDRLLFAEHLDKAGDPRAAGAYLEAARDSVAAHRLDLALALAESGLARAAAPQPLGELLCLKGDILRDLGRAAESLDVFDAALAAAATPRDMLAARIGSVSSMRILDRIDDALALIAVAERVAPEPALYPLLSRLHYLKGGLFFPRGDFRNCLEAHTLARDFAERAGHPELLARALSGLGDAYYAQGRMRKAHGVFEECLALCDRHGLGSVESANRFMLGTTKIYMNETAAALAEARRSAELAAEIGQLRPEIVSRLTAGWVLQSMSEHAAARAEAERGLAAARQLGARRFEPFLRETLVRVLLSEGRRAEAAALADEMLAQTRALGAMSFIGPWVLATYALTRDDAGARAAALAEGEALLAAGCVGHNHFRFRVYAAEACACAGDWPGVRAQAEALAAYTRAEPTPWSDFHIALGHALADAGEGVAGARARLAALADTAGAIDLLTTRQKILGWLDRIA